MGQDIKKWISVLAEWLYGITSKSPSKFTTVQCYNYLQIVLLFKNNLKIILKHSKYFYNSDYFIQKYVMLTWKWLSNLFQDEYKDITKLYV